MVKGLSKGMEIWLYICSQLMPGTLAFARVIENLFVAFETCVSTGTSGPEDHASRFEGNFSVRSEHDRGTKANIAET